MTNEPTTVEKQEYLLLSVIRPDGSRSDHQLQDGGSLIIGSGSNCGLRLGGDEISAMHCVVQFNERKVMVQDWCSSTGTMVDGHRITDEVHGDPGIQIGIGHYTLMTKLDADSMETEDTTSRLVAESSQESPLLELNEAHEGREQAADQDANARTALDAGSTGEPASTSQAESCSEEDQRGPEQTPIPLQATQVTNLPRESKFANSASASGPRHRLTPDQAFNQETIEMLQQELEWAQAELAERDGKIAEMSSLVEFGSPEESVNDTEEMEALVGRLEDLLSELERSDHRIRALEELLRAEQETSHAEQEERVQMERWLNDIEHRVSEREAESRAEREVLTQRVAELREQLEQSDRQIYEAAAVTSPQSAHEGALQNLREDNDRLSEELVTSQEAQRELERQIESLQESTDAKSQQAVVDEALREERMDMAQERATLSRERSELARQIAELQNDELPRSAAVADQKFNAFRQTLKELHEEEDRNNGLVKPSLASRISSLWKRLEGPTDTD
ncbi:MAG: FHA domain-containing protein [Planctomycetaceae bacterium]|nr:FHA domain-containing protein [Planctomycetaceae bacterium]